MDGQQQLTCRRLGPGLSTCLWHYATHAKVKAARQKEEPRQPLSLTAQPPPICLHAPDTQQAVTGASPAPWAWLLHITGLITCMSLHPNGPSTIYLPAAA